MNKKVVDINEMNLNIYNMDDKMETNDNLIYSNIVKYILGFLIKKGKKKKAISALEKSFLMISNNYYFTPMVLLKLILYRNMNIIKMREMLIRKRKRKIFYILPSKFRLQKAVQNLMMNKKVNKNKYIFNIYVTQLLMNKLLSRRNKKVKSKRFIEMALNKIIIPLIRKKKIKLFKIRKIKIINKMKNPVSKKLKQYI